MRRSLHLTHDAIDEAALLRSRQASTAAGAVLTFLGVVRGLENSAPIRALDYECFEPMAAHQFHKLFDELSQQWPSVESVRLVHRLGVVPVGTPSLWVEVMAPHRGEAFSACQWLIDRMKQVVPIWKHSRDARPSAGNDASRPTDGPALAGREA